MGVESALIVFGTGLIAGVINTVAAGGSLLTLPVMIFLGLPAAVANGTNRVGIMVQNISAFSVFTRRGLLDFKLGVWCSIPAFFGCILGVRAAIDLADDWFRKILAAVMILVLAVTLWNPTRKRFSAAGRDGTASEKRP